MDCPFLKEKSKRISFIFVKINVWIRRDEVKSYVLLRFSYNDDASKLVSYPQLCFLNMNLLHPNIWYPLIYVLQRRL